MRSTCLCIAILLLIVGKKYIFGGKIEPYMTSSDNFSSILFIILGALEVEDCTRFIVIWWSVWRARNTFLWEQKPINLNTS
jgi:hypothetical protein